MSERSIVFAADDVQQTLRGYKQRLFQPTGLPQLSGLPGYPRWRLAEKPASYGLGDFCLLSEADPDGTSPTRITCPLGHSGDRLWVRETWLRRVHQVGAPVEYRADGHPPDGRTWRAATTMPRWACRLLLEIEGVQLRRLHDVTEEEAQGGGLPFHVDDLLLRWMPETKGLQWHGPTRRKRMTLGPRLTLVVGHYNTAREALEDWWDHLHPGDPWARNPWIWDVRFKRLPLPHAPVPPEHRGCFTCRYSPAFPTPGCEQLTGDEDQDAGLVAYCEASGVNDEDSPHRGFPLRMGLTCPCWAPRASPAKGRDRRGSC